MKKMMFGLFVLAVFAMTGYAFADNMVTNSDCHNSHRNFATILCPDGYRVQGVAYSDLSKSGDGDSDMMDAVGPVCRKVGEKYNDMIPSDFQRKPLVLMCDKEEIMIGIAYKDIDAGNGGDEMDGISAICQNPQTKAERILTNGDIDKNTRKLYTSKVYLPDRITGIAYKDRGDHSDRADCATITYKRQPIVSK